MQRIRSLKTVSSSSETRTKENCSLSSTPNEAIISVSSVPAGHRGENEKIMKKARDKTNHGEMPREYDFSRGVRGKYARRYAQGANVVVLEPDVAKVFPNAEAVNSSLRGLAEIIRRQKALVAR